jgi:hypothetical protein
MRSSDWLTGFVWMTTNEYSNKKKLLRLDALDYCYSLDFRGLNCSADNSSESYVSRDIDENGGTEGEVQ